MPKKKNVLNNYIPMNFSFTKISIVAGRGTVLNECAYQLEIGKNDFIVACTDSDWRTRAKPCIVYSKSITEPSDMSRYL